MEKILKHNLHRLNFRWGNIVEVLYAVLIPLSLGWALYAFLRRKYEGRRKHFRSSLPVLSVGNIHSGGSGKTPLALAIASHYKNRSPYIVSRGYKASLSRKGAKVDNQGVFAVGDEPWMLHRLFGLSVWIGRDRVKSIKKIEEEKNSALLILDDGFQHFKVERDVNLVLIDSNKSPKENYCLPLGALREPLSALKKASAIVLTGKDPSKFDLWKSFLKTEFSEVKVFEALLKVDGLYQGDVPFSEFRTKKLLGFSGIAGNERFQETLSYLPHSQYYRGFRDHYSYSEEEVTQIICEGKERGAEGFVTTDKDWVKVSRYFRENDEIVLSLRVGYELPADFWNFLDQKLGVRC